MWICFPENPEIINISEKPPLDRKFLKYFDESQMERKLPERNFLKFRYTSQGRKFRKLWKMLFLSPCKFPEMQAGIFGPMDLAPFVTKNNRFFTHLQVSENKYFADPLEKKTTLVNCWKLTYYQESNSNG